MAKLEGVAHQTIEVQPNSQLGDGWLLAQCRQHVVGRRHAVDCSVVQEVLLLQAGLFSCGAVSTLCQIWTHHGSPTADPGTTYYFPNTTQMHLWANETCFECLAACIPHFTEVSQGWDCLHIVPTLSRPIGSMQCTCRYTFTFTFTGTYIYTYISLLHTASQVAGSIDIYSTIA